MLLAHFLLAILCTAAAAVANHVACNFKPTGDSTPGDGYGTFCTANREDQGVRYLCDGHEVATYVTGRNSLNFNTPCGNGGYGKIFYRGREKGCIADQWVICAHAGARQVCYGLFRQDDCQFNENTKFDSVSVYFKK